jgi:hypothetical protein
MAHERNGRCLQKKTAARIGEFRQRRDQVLPAIILHHRFVARELAIKRELCPDKPHQGMKPEDATSDFVDKAYEVVTSLCVRQLMKKNGVKFPTA